MCSRSLSVVAVMAALACADCSKGQAAAPGASRTSGGRTLRVCADPNNLPFSNQREEGFENRLAQLIARDLHARVEYTWWAQRRGFARQTVSSGLCDVIAGVRAAFERT